MIFYVPLGNAEANVAFSCVNSSQTIQLFSYSGQNLLDNNLIQETSWPYEFVIRFTINKSATFINEFSCLFQIWEYINLYELISVFTTCFGYLANRKNVPR